MSDSRDDIGHLSPDQQEALEQYIQVTNQETQEAIPLLQRSQWNVQVNRTISLLGYLIPICIDEEALTDVLANVISRLQLPSSLTAKGLTPWPKQ